MVVTGRPNVTLTNGAGPDATTDVVPLTSYRRVPAALATTLGELSGVRNAVADESVPVALKLPDGRISTGASADPLTGYGWQSAALTPFRLTSGHAPQASNQLVIGQSVARSTALRLGDEVRLVGRSLSPFTVVGVARPPAGNLAGYSTAFFLVRKPPPFMATPVRRT